ncbi:serine/threonine-protein kinase mos-like [Uloborus diversus]|uniref:serine/threonine-protein kinase mos-like n=1 Tax=Uloborus diversus TaxID=327109 RepID=UPI002409FE85|nr:serine/threonine-protein kinase mos-like [Uloborus diversus]
MSFREPLLTISQNPQSPVRSSTRYENSNIETTPKLPKRERLASFSRLLNSAKLKELFADTTFETNSQKAPSSKESASPGSDVSIQIDESSPLEELCRKKRKWNAYLHVPKSPRFVGGNSSPLSPCRLQLTPLRTPLYTPNRSGTFLGRGSFGNVKLFEYKGKRYALKLIHHIQSFVGEKNLLGLSHPHLVKIFHIWNLVDNILICMEFAGHCNLQQLLDTKSDIDFNRRLSFCIQIASGLNHCHKSHIVHGDVKPANVIINPYGICKLGDFGHSLYLKSSEDSIGAADDIVGTAAYAAPEVLRGKRPSVRSDVFSFGILLWQVQSREIPFAGLHPHIVIYKVVHYCERPSFGNTSSKALNLYAETAKLCWSENPENRLEMTEVIQKLLTVKSMERTK